MIRYVADVIDTTCPPLEGPGLCVFRPHTGTFVAVHTSQREARPEYYLMAEDAGQAIGREPRLPPRWCFARLPGMARDDRVGKKAAEIRRWRFVYRVTLVAAMRGAVRWGELGAERC